MPARLYLMPMAADGRYPKYLADLEGLSSAGMDYGAEPVFLVCVRDVPDSVHATLAAYPDVTALPLNLDAQIGAQLGQVQTALESLNLPAQWVQATFTYRQVARIVAAIFQFMQRCHGLGFPRLLEGTVTLNTRFNQLPQVSRQRLLQAAESMQFDTSSLAGTSTIRQILKAMADQWGTLELFLGSEVL